MFSCPVAWFQNALLGIKRDERLFTKKIFIIEPVFPEKLDSVEGSVSTQRGNIRVGWRRDNGRIRLSIKIPMMLYAELRLPGLNRRLDSGLWEFTI